ncbi:MAG: BON domain-containing protein [Actinomycetota bacterium]
MSDQPNAYTAAHVQEALARDGRVGELGIAVDISDGMVVVQGVVPTEERRAAIEEVLGELLPEHEVRNRIVVEPIRDAGEPEVIA